MPWRGGSSKASVTRRSAARRGAARRGIANSTHRANLRRQRRAASADAGGARLSQEKALDGVKPVADQVVAGIVNVLEQLARVYAEEATRKGVGLRGASERALVGYEKLARKGGARAYAEHLTVSPTSPVAPAAEDIARRRDGLAMGRRARRKVRHSVHAGLTQGNERFCQRTGTSNATQPAE